MLTDEKISWPLTRSGAASFLLDPAGDVNGVAHIADVLEEHGEFVAAQPRDGVARAGGNPPACADRDEQLIADRVTQAVVDGLEAVHVEEKDRIEKSARRCDSGDDVLEPVHEQGPVRKARKRIVEGVISMLFFRVFPRGDVRICPHKPL